MFSEPCLCGATDCPRCNPAGQTLTMCGRCLREVKACTLEVAQCGKRVCHVCYEDCDSCEDAEQAAFEDWLNKTCPSGEVEEVQRKWLTSHEYRDFLDEQDDSVARITRRDANERSK